MQTDTIMEETNRVNKRIRIACDICRRKKIKCNGEYPCGNCMQTKGSICHYEERSVKKKTDTHSITKLSTRSKNTKSIEVLNSRLSTLENVILKLTEKIDVIGTGAILGMNGASGAVPMATFKNTANGNMKGSLSEKSPSFSDQGNDARINRSVDSGTNSDDEEDDDDLTASENEKLDVPKREYSSNKVSAESPAAAPGAATSGNLGDQPGKSYSNSNPAEIYFGTHSNMCLFSDKSMDWIEEALGESGKNFITPIRNMPTIFLNKLRPIMLKWIDPPIIDMKGRKRLLECPFPEDPRIAFDLIDTYYKDIIMLDALMPTKQLRSMFKEYYKNFQPPVNGQPLLPKRRFKLSEFLIMAVSLLLCITSKTDDESATSTESATSAETSKSGKSTDQRPLSKMTRIELFTLKNTLMDNVIFFYHRLCVMSDGIETIQGILLLIVYIETSWLSSSLNYILSTVAIRYAQDIGLHRSETYDSFSPEEQARRKKIWWFCHYFDLEICFRTGKPPLINDSDITTDIDIDLFQFCQDFLSLSSEVKPPNLDAYTASQRLLIADESMVAPNLCFLLLTKIRSRSYSQLFVASVQNSSYDTLAKTLDNLNEEMFTLAAGMSDKHKPRFWNDPEFQDVATTVPTHERQALLSVFLGFFLQLMLTNRLPFLIGHIESTEDTERNLGYRNLSNQAARTIMVLVRQLNSSNTSISFFNWIVFYPISAFISIFGCIINHPEHPDSYNDIKLLVESSMNFFETTDRVTFEGGNILKEYSEKDAIMGLLVKMLLRIVIQFYEIKMNVSIIKDFPGLKEHLDIQKTFPHLFKDRATFTKKILALNSRLPGLKDDPSTIAFRTTSNYVPLSRSSAHLSSPSSQSHSYPHLSNILHPQDGPAGGPQGDRLNKPMFKIPSLLPNLPASVNNSPSPFPSHLTPHLNQFQQDFTMSQQGYQPFQSQAQTYNQNQLTSDLSLLQNHNIRNQDPNVENGGEFTTDYWNEDNLSSIFYSQMYNIPNFIFDNNLGI